MKISVIALIAMILTVYLGTLCSDGKVNLNVILDAPAELDSEFQNQTGYLDREFMTEGSPTEDTEPKPPKTGDNSNIGSRTAIMFRSLFMIIFGTA